MIYLVSVRFNPRTVIQPHRAPQERISMAILLAILEKVGCCMPKFEVIWNINESDTCQKSEQSPLIKQKVIACQRILFNSSHFLAILATMANSVEKKKVFAYQRILLNDGHFEQNPSE